MNGSSNYNCSMVAKFLDRGHSIEKWKSKLGQMLGQLMYPTVPVRLQRSLRVKSWPVELISRKDSDDTSENPQRLDAKPPIDYRGEDIV